MLITLIAAMSEDHAIGNNNALLWHLPADLQHFKALTTGKAIVMGRKTWDSIGRPLPNRHNIIISRNQTLSPPGCHVAHTPEAAINLAKQLSDSNQEIMIIGGAKIYELFLPLAQRMELTFVSGQYKADAYFPQWDANQWQLSHQQTPALDDKNTLPYRFVTLERKP